MLYLPQSKTLPFILETSSGRVLCDYYVLTAEDGAQADAVPANRWAWGSTS
jgi:hypothetical protein